MHLSPESLEAFVQAVSLGSFSAAARKLGKSQSTVSEAIARLEIDLGLELFDRSGRQPQLTEAGRTLLGRVEEVLGASDRLRRVAALLAGGSEPRVTLALSDTYHSARYEARLAELDERYPELEFECLIAEDQDVIAQVSRGRVTLGLLAAQPHYPPELGVAAVAERAEFGLFAAVDHPLAGLERVSERDLSEWRLLRLNTYSETGAAINDGLPSSGGRCWSAPNYLLLLEMATHGFGWAELPRWLVSGYANGRLKELPVSGWPRSQAVDVVWSRQRSVGTGGQLVAGPLAGSRPAYLGRAG